MSKIQSKRLNALKTLALVIAIGVGYVMQTHPAQASATSEMPELQIGQE